MEQNLNPEQIAQIRENRKKILAQMGVRNGGQMMNESMVQNGGANLNILQKIQQIKSGAAKHELNKYVNATAKSGGLPGMPGFDPIPVSKSKKHPNIPQQQVSPEHKVELEAFSNTSNIDNSELSMIENLFGGGGSRTNIGGFGNMQQRPMNTQIDLDSTLNNMPMFNPEHAIQRAKSKNIANGENNQFLKFAQKSPIGQPQDYVVNDPTYNQQMNSMGITPAMKVMMETIAKTMAEQTIKNVLNEFTEQQQKNKMYFEVYNKEQSIIKTSDGKLYKITPVQVKKKNS